MQSILDLAPLLHVAEGPATLPKNSQLVRAVRRNHLRGPKFSTSLIDPFALPGMGTAVISTENAFVWGTIASWQTIGVVIAAAAVDAGNTPTTTLRKGLMMGALGQFQLSPGVLVQQYADGLSNGAQFCVGILLEDVNMLDQTNTAVNKFGRILWFGNVKAAKLIGLTLQSRRQLASRIFFDDGLTDNSQYQAIIETISQAFGVTTGTLTVLATMNNATFDTTGATGALNFALPAIASVASGWRIRILANAAQNTVVTAPAGLLVGFNNAAATTLTFSTAGNLIGASVEIVVNAAGTKYIAIPGGNGNTAVYA